MTPAALKIAAVPFSYELATWRNFGIIPEAEMKDVKNAMKHVIFAAMQPINAIVAN